MTTSKVWLHTRLSPQIHIRKSTQFVSYTVSAAEETVKFPFRKYIVSPYRFIHMDQSGTKSNSQGCLEMSQDIGILSLLPLGVSDLFSFRLFALFQCAGVEIPNYIAEMSLCGAVSFHSKHDELSQPCL